MKQQKKASLRSSLNVDCVIVGRGMVGSVLALSLLHHGFSVALIEQKQKQRSTKDPGKAFTLSLGALRQLETLGLGSSVYVEGYPLKKVHVSRIGGHAHLSFVPDEIDEERLGCVIREQNLQNIVTQALESYQKAGSSKLCVFQPDTISEVQWNPSNLKILLASGKRVACCLLIGCDGRFSKIKGSLDTHELLHDYKQHALLFTIQHEAKHEGQAFEHFTPWGACALLPMQEHVSAVVWNLDNQFAKPVIDQPKALLNSLIHHFGWGLGKLKLISKITVYPLSARMPLKILGYRRVILGDAAHAIHPVAGQGLNLGLRDAFFLANKICHARKHGLDYGSATLLEGYQRLRHYDRWLLASFTHSLVKGFQDNLLHRIIPFAWDMGVQAVHVSPRLKRKILLHAAGLDGDSRPLGATVC